MTEEKFTYLDTIVSEDEAKRYIDRRFSSKRMQKMHKQECAFATYVVSLVEKCQKIADIPCGSGRFTDIFSANHELYGFDYNPHMVEEAQKSNRGKNAIFAVGDIKKIPLEDKSVHTIFSMRLLHHVQEDVEREKIVSELVRVAQKYVAFSFYRKETLKYLKKKLRGKNISGYPVATKHMLKIAQNQGLRLKKIKYLSGYQTLALFEIIS